MLSQPVDGMFQALSTADVVCRATGIYVVQLRACLHLGIIVVLGANRYVMASYFT